MSRSQDNKRNTKPSSKEGPFARQVPNQGDRHKLKPTMLFQDWVDETKTVLGMSFEWIEYIMRKQKIPVIQAPILVTCQEQIDMTNAEWGLRQLNNGVVQGNVQPFPFGASTFEEALHAYNIGDPEIGETLGGLTQADKDRMDAMYNTVYVEACKIYRKDLHELKKALPKMYNAILDKVGKESKDKLRTHPNIDWEEIEDGQDPADLMKVLKISHTIEQNGSRAMNQRSW